MFKKILILISLWSFHQFSFGQISNSDSILMGKALNEFNNDSLNDYYLLDETFDVHFALTFCGPYDFNGIDSLKTKLSLKVKMDFYEISNKFNPKNIFGLKNAIVINSKSEILNRLRFNMTVLSGTSKKEIEDIINPRIEKLKEKYRSSELKVYKISEPYYDRSNKFMIIGIDLFEPNFETSYIMLYKKIKSKWTKLEIRKLCFEKI